MLAVQDLRNQQKIWSGTAKDGLRDCCYLPNNMDNVDCLIAAGTDGALHVCHHREINGKDSHMSAKLSSSSSTRIVSLKPVLSTCVQYFI